MTKIKFYYQTPLIDTFNPKTIADVEKVKELEKLLIRYIFVRILEKMNESDVKDLEKNHFGSLTEFAEYFNDKIPDFNKRFRQYISEFLQNYVRSN